MTGSRPAVIEKLETPVQVLNTICSARALRGACPEQEGNCHAARALGNAGLVGQPATAFGLLLEFRMVFAAGGAVLRMRSMLLRQPRRGRRLRGAGAGTAGTLHGARGHAAPGSDVPRHGAAPGWHAGADRTAAAAHRSHPASADDAVHADRAAEVATLVSEACRAPRRPRGYGCLTSVRNTSQRIEAVSGPRLLTSPYCDFLRP